MIDTPRDPVPFTHEGADPSPLTTQQILRENAWLRHYVDTRFTAVADAMALLQEALNRDPPLSVVNAKVDHLKELINQRFLDGKTALDAALQEKDHANVKQEGRVNDRINAIDRRHDDNKTATDRTINGLEIRMARIESQKETGTATRGTVIAIGGLSIMFVAAMVAVITLAMKMSAGG